MGYNTQQWLHWHHAHEQAQCINPHSGCSPSPCCGDNLPVTASVVTAVVVATVGRCTLRTKSIGESGEGMTCGCLISAVSRGVWTCTVRLLSVHPSFHSAVSFPLSVPIWTFVVLALFSLHFWSKWIFISKKFTDHYHHHNYFPPKIYSALHHFTLIGLR